MKTFRFILGYLIGLTLFGILIPWLLVKGAGSSLFGLSPGIIPGFPVRLIIALPLFCVGFLFAVWSNISLYDKGKGGPTDAFNVAISPRSERLVTTGPYRYCRHPMVFGALSVYLSISVFVNSLPDLSILIILIPFFVLYLKMTEEKRLLKDFGDEYVQYRSKVPMIVPFTKLRKEI